VTPAPAARARRDAGTRILSSVAGLAAAAAVVAAHDPITTRVTWTGEISRIVQARCVTCHSPHGRGPMSLRTYEDARPWARAIKEEVMTRRMPKWHAVRGYGDFSNDPSLSAFEIALIAAWADGGAPRGVEVDARAMSSAKSTTPGRIPTPPPSRDVTLPCGEQPLPEGTLLAVQPELEPEESAGIAVRLPDGRREIVAWIKGFDPEFPTIYRLRTPLLLPPGSVIATEARGTCALTLTIAARR
jgi:hypothetical protein